MHALYALARYADDIVDDFTPSNSSDREFRLTQFQSDFMRDLKLGRSSHPVAAATVHTARQWEIPSDHFEAFFVSMRQDLTKVRYETYEELAQYMYGSAAVIGLQMLPILEPRSSLAAPAARDLGFAFQLANFIRDVGEDLDRGRVYLPLDELAAHGVTIDTLQRRQVTTGLRAALSQQVQRVRDLQRSAQPGISYLAPSTQPCINTASTLYCEIADEVERNGYDVFTRRARVGLARRLRVASRAYVQARRAR